MLNDFHISFFGSSLVSSYWNGAATYYRGILHALARRGARITFYESNAYERQQHRDMEDPPWATVVVYPADNVDILQLCLLEASRSDMIVKASGNGVFDEFLEAEILRVARAQTLTAFWDVDAPATLDRLDHNSTDPLIRHIPRYDFVFTYGGGPPVLDAYHRRGARLCVPIYNALDPATHHRVEPQAAFTADLNFLGNRLPDREHRVEAFLIEPARKFPRFKFLLGGSGWLDRDLPSNLTALGHIPSIHHNAFNSSPRMVLSINRESMARYGYSPATRIFEAAGAGACIITDQWPGIEEFLTPGKEVLVAASGEEVSDFVRRVSATDAHRIGEAALRRILAEHTYEHRAAQWEEVVVGRAALSGASR